MSPFVRVNPGDLIQAQNLNQVVGSLNGTSGQGVPVAQTSVNDASNYAVSVQNLEATNSRALNVLKSDGSLLIRADVNGVNLGTPVTMVKLASDVGRASLLTNGGFEVWQRGNNPPLNGYTADRWNSSAGTSASVSISKDTTNVDVGSGACAAFGVSNPGTTPTLLAGQTVELGAWRGLTYTWSMRIKSDAATTGVLQMIAFDADGTTQLASLTLNTTTTYQTYSLTFTSAATGNKISCNLRTVPNQGAGRSHYVDNAMLVVGSQAADYVPMHPADDLARCLRYYETLGGAANTIHVRAYAGDVNITTFGPIVFAAKKAVTPTLTKVGTWTVSGCGQPVFDSPTLGTARLSTTPTGTGVFAYFTPDATCYLTIEANP